MCNSSVREVFPTQRGETRPGDKITKALKEHLLREILRYNLVPYLSFDQDRYRSTKCFVNQTLRKGSTVKHLER